MFNTSTLKRNHLLASLSKEVQDRLFPLLQPLSLELGKSVYESGDTLHHVYFPIDSIVSLLHITEDGASSEISMIGNDGLIGIALFMRSEKSPSQAVVQSSGIAYRLEEHKFRDELRCHGELEHLLLRYSQTLMTQMGQIAVCNRHHSIDQQLCRWLLLCMDRLSSNCMIMTHELISRMLGVRRESITEAAGKLQRQGVIECHRGQITVLDRPKLEELSCECYGVVKAETDRLLPYNIDTSPARLRTRARA